ncbi:MAG: N-acetylmuramoyl-L-alanine amidase [Kofleriaceae bacterium]|nr:MAG: N-acetylmuramoyl-L-alanine amidase [Kofleriaceae bacterium]
MLDRVKERMAVAKAPLAVTSELLVTENGWLEGPGVIRLPSPRSFRLTSRAHHDEPGPVGVCWHWTGGVCRPGYAGVLAKKISTYNPKKDRAASWHLVISKQGWVYQSVPFELGSWHCAVGTVKDDRGHTHRVNRSLTGIELENSGRLKYLDGRWYCHPFWKQDKAGAFVEGDDFNRVPDPKLVVETERMQIARGHGSFDGFPDPQVIAAGFVLRALVERYGLPANRCGFLHGDFDKRKEDAGPLWRNLLVDVYERAGLDAAVLTTGGHA